MDTLDPERLRTFLAFADSGSLARAAAIMGRSASAVTAQMQRLEEIVGEPLLAAAGRGRVLSQAGEQLVIHARKILAAHREAWLSLKGARVDGKVSIGATQDFADSILPALLRDFARTHARVRLDLRVGRSMELAKAFEESAIDILLAMRLTRAADEVGVLREPMLWFCATEGLVTTPVELPIAFLDPPCGFRVAAMAALDAAGRSYRLAATSPSLSGLRAAVRGGIAVTVRTPRFIDAGIVRAPRSYGLPNLPEAEFSIRLRADATSPATDLAQLLVDILDVSRMPAAASKTSPRRPRRNMSAFRAKAGVTTTRSKRR
jgi:DNA-binding transcriptional LysR family regulator